MLYTCWHFHSSCWNGNVAGNIANCKLSFCACHAQYVETGAHNKRERAMRDICKHLPPVLAPTHSPQVWGPCDQRCSHEIVISHLEVWPQYLPYMDAVAYGSCCMLLFIMMIVVVQNACMYYSSMHDNSYNATKNAWFETTCTCRQITNVSVVERSTQSPGKLTFLQSDSWVTCVQYNSC